MMRLRFLAPLVGLASFSVFAAACSNDKVVDVGAAGAAGEAPTGGAAVACTTAKTGTVVVEVSGLPDSVMPDVSIAGPDMLDATDLVRSKRYNLATTP